MGRRVNKDAPGRRQQVFTGKERSHRPQVPARAAGAEAGCCGGRELQSGRQLASSAGKIGDVSAQTGRCIGEDRLQSADGKMY